MGREFELKYASDPAQQEKILEDLGEFTTICMETSYYDTPDGALAAQNITLRRRLENGVSVCTVKTPLDTHGRGEWETECTDITLAIPMLCKLGAPGELLVFTAGGLMNTCGAAFTRRAATLAIPGAVIELAVDRGRLFAGEREAPICEVEAELKEGSEEALLRWAEEFARRYALSPEPKSKVARASALAREGIGAAAPIRSIYSDS